MTDCETLNPSTKLSEHTGGNRPSHPRSWMRMPQLSDAAGIHRLISECPPLDLNSVYTYLLLSEHFGASCVLAGAGDTLHGFVSGYVPPERPNTLFIWQVAVHAQGRGQSLGRRMMQHLLQRPGLSHIQFIETTVGPDNRASRAMFAGLARKLLAPINEQPLFERHMFGAHAHEDEPLLRIGPFATASLP